MAITSKKLLQLTILRLFFIILSKNLTSHSPHPKTHCLVLEKTPPILQQQNFMKKNVLKDVLTILSPIM